MKKNGFTLTEMLAVMLILALLLIIGIPAYIKIFNNVKRDNYLKKIDVIETAMMKYGENIKDEIKNKYDLGEGCYETNIETLIQKGYLESEDDIDDFLINPIDGTKMERTVYSCYCPNALDIKSYYAEEFDNSKAYYRGDIVRYEVSSGVHQFFEATTTYTGKECTEEELKVPNTECLIKNDKKDVYATFKRVSKNNTDTGVHYYFKKLTC